MFCTIQSWMPFTTRYGCPLLIDFLSSLCGCSIAPPGISCYVSIQVGGYHRSQVYCYLMLGFLLCSLLRSFHQLLSCTYFVSYHPNAFLASIIQSGEDDAHNHLEVYRRLFKERSSISSRLAKVSPNLVLWTYWVEIPWDSQLDNAWHAISVTAYMLWSLLNLENSICSKEMQYSKTLLFCWRL